MALNHSTLSNYHLNISLPFYSSAQSSSLSTPNPTSSPDEMLDHGTIAGALILSIVFLLGVPGNLFVIWSIVARARRRSVTTLLILNLACADGTVMVLTPFFIIYLIRQSWVFGLAMCKVMFYLCCANMYASIFLITLMSLHRLVAVVWPRHLRTLTMQRTMVRVLLVAWLLALALAIPVLTFRKVIVKNATEDTGVKSLKCECLHPQPAYAVVQYTMETFLGFLLPYGLILGSYLCILRKIRNTKFQRRIRSEKLILAIVITFCLFWLPYHIVNIVQVAEALAYKGSTLKEMLHKFWTSMRVLTSTVAFVSSSINPVLYTLVGKAYMRSAGLAFMARLFEAAGLDTTSRKTRMNSRDRDRDKEENKELRDKESDSTTSANTSSNVKVVPLKMGCNAS